VVAAAAVEVGVGVEVEVEVEVEVQAVVTHILSFLLSLFCQKRGN
jgi:hypothetical protein